MTSTAVHGDETVLRTDDLPDLGRFLDHADALIVVPPFAGLDRPSLGAHVVQACARARGYDVRLLYANILLASQIGEASYGQICFASTSDLLGERFFARAAYGASPEVYGGAAVDGEPRRRGPAKLPADLPPERFAELASCAGAWCDALADVIAATSFSIVGCTSTFEQTAASVALLDCVKARRPGVTTIMGGANCEGAMAEGIHSLNKGIDYVFSAESELTFPAFLEAFAAEDRPEDRVIRGKPCRNMDSVPTPDFSEYYTQLEAFLPDSETASSGSIWLPYESSRGCWWGEKTHCTFCGINGGGMVFRQKSPDRVISELRELTARHPTNLVCMVDNIMPHEYFKTLIPRLSTELPGLHFFYEQKANLTLDRVVGLKAAGVAVVQPGIEALSTPLLKLMKKGVSAPQNIALLRYARITELAINWNLLYAFPGDRASWYEDTLALMPLVAHLNPPTSLCHLSIDRFSPYFEQPEAFDVTNVRPMASYADVLPADADQPRIAYHFQADYESESRGVQALVERLNAGVAAWRERWQSDEEGLPALEMAQLSEDTFLLADTRGLEGTMEFEFIDPEKAEVALVGATPVTPAEAVAWALARKACVELDGKIVPLATAEVGVLRSFEAARRPERRQQTEVLPVALQVARAAN
jgi:ribosomal peptide maturation radical SAM protein 1